MASCRLYLQVLVMGTISAMPAAASTPDPLALYGDEIAFEVLRDGEPIGFHRATFEWQGDRLRVVSEMELAITFLSIPVFEYRYEAEEIWRGGELEDLRVRVEDDGEARQIEAARQDDVLLVQAPERHHRVEGGIFPTNHWNPAVLTEDRVLNTLTGNVNRVDIRPVGQERVAVADGEIEATRYVYDGELRTEAWYDPAGRWVKLRFEGSDGSDIEYRCVTCRVSAAQ